MTRFAGEVHRDPQGYEWVDADGRRRGEDGFQESTLFLRPFNWDALQDELADSIEKGRPLTNVYDPFQEEPALFRIFAALEPTEAAIVDFANRYGGVSNLIEIQFVGGGEIPDWKTAIQDMRKWVERADTYLSRRRAESVKNRDVGSALDLVNEQLKSIAPRLRAAPHFQKVGVQIVATNLMDTMKLQLIASIDEEKRYHDCEFCGKPFELRPQLNRANRQFCTDNCRVKAYQRRRKQAIEMRGTGHPLREIAKKTQTPLATVKKWVESNNEREK